MIAAIGIAFGGGCAATVNPEQMVPRSLAPAGRRSERTVSVAAVTGGAEPNKLVVELMDQVNIGNAEFRVALIKALEASGVFREVLTTETSDYQLDAHIVSQQPQRAGFLTVTSSFVVNYSIRETGSNREVWRDTIISHETAEGAPFTEGVPGAMKKSLAGAARQNLTEMIEKISRQIQ